MNGFWSRKVSVFFLGYCVGGDVLVSVVAGIIIDLSVTTTLGQMQAKLRNATVH